MDKGVNRTSVGRVLTKVPVQSPSIDRDASRHLFGISKHVVNRANSTKRPGRVVLKGVHDEVCSGSDAAGISIARTVAEHGNGDVRAMAAVAVRRGWVKSKLREGGGDPTGQIGMVLVQSCVSNGNHLSRAVKGKRGVVGHALDARNRPSQCVMNSPLGGGFGPQDSTVVGQMTDQLRHGERFGGCVAHPCIARSFEATVPDDIRCQGCVAPNTQIGCGNDGQGFSSSGL